MLEGHINLLTKSPWFVPTIGMPCKSCLFYTIVDLWPFQSPDTTDWLTDWLTDSLTHSLTGVIWQELCRNGNSLFSFWLEFYLDKVIIIICVGICLCQHYLNMLAHNVWHASHFRLAWKDTPAPYLWSGEVNAQYVLWK